MALGGAAGGNRVLLYRMGRVGLGHVLSSLLNAAAWALAERRALAIDAAHFTYFAGDAHRQFHECFAVEAPAELQVITDPAAIAALRAVPNILHVVRPDDLAQAAEARERVVMVHGTPLTDAYPAATRPTPPSLRIGLRGWLRDRVESGLAPLRADGPLIGIYLRHGNGEHLNGRFDTESFPDHAARLAELQRRYAAQAGAIAKAQGWRAPRHFVASDNADFVAAMRALLPNSVALARNLPDRNFVEHIKVQGHDPDILFEATQDLWALSSCSALVYSTSLFARCAILNSATLDPALAYDIAAPTLRTELRDMSPQSAVAIAEAAYRAKESRVNGGALAVAYARAGDTASEAKIRRRLAWHDAYQSDATVRLAQSALAEQRPNRVLAHVAAFEATQGPNPFVLLLRARALRAKGEHAAAIAALEHAVALDDGITRITSVLDAMRTRKKNLR